MKKKVFNLVLMIFVLWSCSDNSSKLTRKTLSRTLEIEQLSDSSFLKDVRSTSFYKGKFYLSDYNRNQVLVLDKSLELRNTIGVAGKGPGEFIGASQNNLFNDTIYVQNGGKNTIEMLDLTGNNARTIPLPPIPIKSEARFVKCEKGMYFSSVVDGHSIIYLDKDGKKKSFGILDKYNSDKETNIKNKKHILIYNDKIIAVPDNKPKIEMYDLNGNLIKEYDYSQIEIVSQTIDYIDRQKKTENSYYVLVEDAYINSGKLFFLINTWPYGKYTANNIIEFEINDEGFRESCILDLGEGWFSSFCVADGELLAWNGSLIKFKLN